MPVELESGKLLLTEEEIVLYRPATALAAKAFHEDISLDRPISHLQFTMLFLAYGVATGDDDTINDVIAVAESEIAKRKHPN